MSEATTQIDADFNLAELVNLSAKLLDRIFLRAPRNKVEPIFDDLVSAKAVALGSTTSREQTSWNLRLVLDRSEFVGAELTLDVFVTCLDSILQQISHAFAQGAELNVMSSETAVLLNLPGAVKSSEQLNVMVLAFELVSANAIDLKLMFMEPGQYEPYIK